MNLLLEIKTERNDESKKQYSLLHSFVLLFCLLFSLRLEATQQNELRQKLMEDVQILSADEMEGRKSPSNGHKLAQAYLINAFKEEGLLPFPSYLSFKQQFTITSNSSEGANILGYIEGQQHSDTFIVITSHYDHLGKKGSRIFNGANDNASGVAALLALADISQPRRQLIVWYLSLQMPKR